MKKFALILFCSFLMIISFGCKANVNEPENQETPEAPDPENQNPSNPSSPAAVLVNQFFWGQWQRMDNGKSYYINENNIRTDERLYSATSSSENYLNVEGLGRFEKQTDSVIINNSIPYFRKGGTNLSYKMKLVGFEDSINRAARAASSASLRGYTITGTSEQFESFTSEAVSDEDGTVTLTAPTSGDVQTITVTRGDDTIVVVPGIKVETDGSNMGTIPISQEGQYSLKVTGTIEDSEKDDGYLYGNDYKSYPMTLTITNVSDVVSAPSVCTITAEDSRVTVSSADGSDITGGVLISTLKSGFTKTILLSVTCGTLTESYLDTGLIVTVINAATEKTWQDYVPLRFFKGLVPITVAAESVEENADAALNGFVIYPDGNSQFFSVPDKGDKTIYVPTFGSDQPYTLAFSGATIDGLLSNSTEMLYTVASETWAKKEIDTAATAFIDAVQYGETGSGNGSEDNATVADSEFEAYLADGDVDFYLLGLNCLLHVFPNYNESYTVTYESDYGSAPSAKTVSIGTVLTNNQLQQLAYKGYDFNGWYIGSKKIEAGFVVTSNITLKAKWSPKSYSITYNLNGGENNSLNPDKYTYSENEESVIKLENPTKDGFIFEGWYSTSSFSDEIITEIHRNIASEVHLYAKWEQVKFKVTADTLSNLNLSKCKYNTTIIVTGDITENIIISLASKIETAKSDIYLDLSEAEGLTEIKRFGNNGTNDSDFANCEHLKSIVLPNCLETLGDYAFWNCYNLESVALPEGLTTIGNYVFVSCVNLKTLTIPDSVISFGSMIFYACKSLTEFIIPKGMTEIPDSAFEYCTSLNSIVIPDYVTAIRGSAFDGCTSLKSVSIADSVKTIGYAAFRNCLSLVRITIPETVTKIGSNCFSGCTNLTSITFENTSTWYYTSDFYYKNGTVCSVTRPSKNATYFTSTYVDKYWYKE